MANFELQVSKLRILMAFLGWKFEYFGVDFGLFLAGAAGFW